MALTVKNPNVELVVGQAPPPRRDLLRFLETHVWLNLPADVRGRPITKDEEEAYLGLGPGGV